MTNYARATANGLYILLDFSNGKELRQTGIPISIDKLGNHLIEDDGIRDFLKNQLKREDLTICSYWTR